MYGNIPFEISLKDNEIYPPLEEARKLAKERTEQYYKINKIRYDKKFQEADFKVGDLVMYEEFQYPNTRKLSPPYPGPYTVLRKCSDVLFEIDRPNALNKPDTELVHSVRLRHFHPSENFQLNYIQQNTHNNEKKIITKRNILRNTEITEFCLTRLCVEKENDMIWAEMLLFHDSLGDGSSTACVILIFSLIFRPPNLLRPRYVPGVPKRKSGPENRLGLEKT
ncbi:retrotransposable element Tf2 protein type 1 [Trichonephila clavipes]|nr:retrotransposable element Tf2 protein type 1 [Trichonephila clavipes]